jgi:hypothetical protein
MYPGRICRHSESDNKGLLKVREKWQEPWWARYEIEAKKSSWFQVLLKPMITYERGKDWEILYHQNSMSREGFGWSLA